MKELKSGLHRCHAAAGHAQIRAGHAGHPVRRVEGVGQRRCQGRARRRQCPHRRHRQRLMSHSLPAVFVAGPLRRGRLAQAAADTVAAAPARVRRIGVGVGLPDPERRLAVADQHLAGHAGERLRRPRQLHRAAGRRGVLERLAAYDGVHVRLDLAGDHSRPRHGAPAVRGLRRPLDRARGNAGALGNARRS